MSSRNPELAPNRAAATSDFVSYQRTGGKNTPNIAISRWVPQYIWLQGKRSAEVLIVHITAVQSIAQDYAGPRIFSLFKLFTTQSNSTCSPPRQVGITQGYLKTVR